MKILRLGAGILAGLIAVTAITESVEFVTVRFRCLRWCGAGSSPSSRPRALLGCGRP